MKMWPVYLLLNKILGAEGDIQETEECHLSWFSSYQLEESLDHDKHTDSISSSHSTEVPHINQVHTWDCGLACVLMVLRAHGINDPTLQELEDVCSTTSIWTVDLAYLLKKFAISFQYFTITLEANPNFSGETFYKSAAMQEQLHNDILRVNVLFQRAREAGIIIQRRSISAKEISLLILSGKHIAIALVDQYKLRPSWTEDICLAGFDSNSPDYTGHYVVICGYDSVRDEFEIRDPARSRKDERVSSRCLEEARKSFGTDEDLLLINLFGKE
ncbi:hypothetical protein Leryth_009797 [Lithospermum erythrorhizon]|nr:hypothetical protein Leryth_009797 [Lithospermum erythrorhizon]